MIHPSNRHGRRIALAMLTALSAPVLLAPLPALATSPAETADRVAYVLMSPGGSSSTMSGSTDDIRRAQSLRRGQEGLLYVRQGAAAYVIRDAAALREAQAIFEPQRILGAKQGELGSRQADLGRRQAELGAEQARLGLRQANARAREAGELGRQQNELGRRQGLLGQQQAVLGREQGALGQEQGRLARAADAKIRALIADAIRRGIAQRVD
jgi:hypothetical protein